MIPPAIPPPLSHPDDALPDTAQDTSATRREDRGGGLMRGIAAAGCAVAAPLVAAQGVSAGSAAPAAGGASWLKEWIQSLLPADWVGGEFLLYAWQWAGLLGAVVLGALAQAIVTRLVGRAVRRLLRKRAPEVADGPLARIERPLGLCALAGVFLLALPALALPGGAHALFETAATFVVAVGGVWAVYRVVDVAAAFFQSLAAKSASTLDDALVPFLSKVLKIFVVAFGVVFVAQNLRIEVGSLLAGLGLGGLAIALAAKDTVENLFGSVTVLLDRPFQVGDWVVIGQHEGTVETLGFRSTRIRTFYHSLISIPNAVLVHQAIDNMGARRYRRIRTMISITYDTPAERIDAFCEGIRELIRRHPYTRKDYYHVYFNNFGPSSLDLLLYCFVETPEWATELREKHRLYLDIVRLARRLGVEFAFPTQTLHLGAETVAGLAGRPVASAPGAPAEPAETLGRREAARLTADGHVKPPPVVIQTHPSTVPPARE